MEGLTRVVTRAAGILGVHVDSDAASEIASRSRGTPRIANRLLRRVRDFADVNADGRVTLEVAKAALLVFDVDESGLDRLDRAVLDALVRGHGAWASIPSHRRRRRALNGGGSVRALPRAGRHAGGLHVDEWRRLRRGGMWA